MTGVFFYLRAPSCPVILKNIPIASLWEDNNDTFTEF
jgi:hypothetical protein